MRQFDLSKFFVGLDQFYNTPFLATEYPRYNIGKTDKGYKLVMALPGWNPGDVSLTLQDNTLMVIGEKQEAPTDMEWVHKGISGKSFEKAFKVNSNLEVKRATFKNGILEVNMEYTPETRAVDIPIEVLLENRTGS